MSLAQFMEAVFFVITPVTLLFILVGLLIGTFVGGLPGIGPSIAMVLTLPLTLFVEPNLLGIVLLISIYNGGLYGSSIAAILLNTPGAAGSAATTFDGYALSRQGKSLSALSASAVGSSVGGLIATTLILLLVPFLVPIVLMFGSIEYFLVAFLGLLMIALISQGNLLKGVIGGATGLLVASVGVSDYGTSRFTLGYLSLYDGFSFIAVLVGLFAITEMIFLAGERGTISKQRVKIEGERWAGIRAAIKNPVLLIKSSLIGMFVGAVPGAGASVANFVAYGEALRSLKPDVEFGKGAIEGVLAPESSNNASCSGSIVPTIAFGIPGSGGTAVLLGGLLMHGIRPGPDLFGEQLAMTYSMFLAFFVSSIFILVIGLTIITKMNFVTELDTDLIIPNIVVLGTIGAYSLRTNWVDVITIFALGIFGYFLVKHKISVIAFVLGAVLGPIAEINLLRSLQFGDGSLGIFFSTIPATVLSMAIIFVLLSPVLKVVLNAVRHSGGKSPF
jgi:putative tricarboxylic transport membrane protein